MKKPIRVVTQYFPPDQAATGQFIESLVQELSKKNNWEFEINTGLPSYAKLNKVKNLNYKKNILLKINRTFISDLIPKKFKGRIINSLLFCVYSFINLAIKSKKDELVIFTTEPPFLTLLPYFLCKIKKLKYILIIYDLYPQTLINLGILKKNGLIEFFWRKINTLNYKYASHIIVLSKNMKNILENEYPYIKKGLSVISSWEDPEEIYPIKKEKNWFIKKYNLESKFIILYSGNQGRLHDFDTILSTAKNLQSHRDIIFLFIGNGNQNKYILNESIKNNLKNCFFLPYQEKKNIIYSLNSADIALVSIAKNANGLIAPSKLYGHLAAGTPIAAIAPKNSYLRELIDRHNFGKHFINGDYINLANWILDLKNNKKSSFSKSARSFLIRFASKKIIISKYEEILKQFM